MCPRSFSGAFFYDVTLGKKIELMWYGLIMKNRLILWMFRLVTGCVLFSVLGFCVLLGYFFIVVELRNQAAKKQADVFVTLKGSARRIAIFDAATRIIEAHYYDQKFTGLNWPLLRSQSRVKAEHAEDDFHLYWDVLIPLSMAFPGSHMGFSMPSSAPASIPSENVKPGAARQCEFDQGGMTLASIQRKAGRFLMVAEVTPGSPAAQAGVVPGWPVQAYSLQLDGGSLKNTVTLLPLNSLQQHDFGLTGEGAYAPSHHDEAAQKPQTPPLSVTLKFTSSCHSARSLFESRRLPDGPLYIRFDKFDALESSKVVTALQSADRRGVIIDLRSNVGGYPRQFLSQIMPRGAELYRLKRSSGFETVRADYWTHRYTGKIVVLIGPASTSAAEIVPWVLRHVGKALVVGRPTGGAVLGGKFYPLPDGGVVEVAVTDIEMLDGSQLEGKGVVPDVEVYPTPEEIRSGKDAVLDAAIHALGF